MLDLLVLAAETVKEEEEAAPTLFYIAGGVLAAWAVLLAAIGLSRPEFPGSDLASRAVMAVSALLVAAAMAAAVVTG